MRPQPARLLRVLGLGFGVAVGVGSMIGAGILRTPGDIAARLPTPALFLGVWVLGAAYALLGANALAELGAMMPKSGGQYVYARRAFGEYAAFVVGWNDWLSTCGSVAAVALIFGASTGALVPALVGYDAVTGVALMAIIAGYLLLGVREGDRGQRLTSLLKAAALAALVIACFIWAIRSGGPGVGPEVIAPRGLGLLAALVVALQAVIYSYDGWNGPIYFSEEVQDPGRDLPRALFGGVLTVMVVYLMVNVAFLAVLPMGVLARSDMAAASAAGRVFGERGSTVVHVLVLLALPSAIVANLLMVSRVSFGLARDGAAPRMLTRVNRGGTPSAALIASAVACALFALTGAFQRVIAICAFLFVATYAVSFTALFVLRAREPDTPRPYRAWMHPWTTALALAGSLAFLGGMVAADRRNGLLALGLALVSWPVWRLGSRR